MLGATNSSHCPDFLHFSPLKAKITLALGVSAAVVGVFLLLASYQLLPGINSITLLGIGGKIGGGLLLGIWLAATIGSALYLFKTPNPAIEKTTVPVSQEEIKAKIKSVVCETCDQLEVSDENATLVKNLVKVASEKNIQNFKYDHVAIVPVAINRSNPFKVFEPDGKLSSTLEYFFDKGKIDPSKASKYIVICLASDKDLNKNFDTELSKVISAPETESKSILASFVEKGGQMVCIHYSSNKKTAEAIIELIKAEG